MAKQVSEKKQERRRQEELFTYRILITLLIVIAAIFALIEIGRAYSSPRSLLTAERVLGNLRWIGLAAFVVLEILAIAVIRIKKDGKSYLSRIFAYIGLAPLLASAVAAYVLWTYGISMGLLYVSLPMLALLYLIYHIYQKEFFMLALYVSSGALGLWFLSRVMLNPGRRLPLSAAYTLVFVAIAVSAGLIFLLKKGDGILKVGKLRWQILPAGSKYVFLFIACAALLLISLLAVLFSWSIAWYGVMVMFAYLFVVAVYYTVKMM